MISVPPILKTPLRTAAIALPDDFALATFGYLQQHTGSVSGRLYGPGIASLNAH